MSRRRVENTFSASSFSLSQINSVPTASVVTASPLPTPPPTQHQLKWNLSGLKCGVPASASPSSPVGAGGTASENSSIQSLVQKNGFISVFKSSPAQTSQDLIRMTAQRDDLRTRLKGASEKAGFLQTQLERLQKTTLRERSEFGRQVGAMKNEMMKAKDSETKLKAHVSKLQAEAEKRASFASAVQSAIDETEVLEAKAKLEETKRAQATIEAQVTALTESKAELMGEIESVTKRRDEHRGEIASISDELATLKEAHEAAKEQVASLESEREVHVEAIRLSHEEMKALEALLEEEKLKHASLSSSIDASASKLAELDAAVLQREREFQSTPVASPPTRVFGDEHPSDSAFHFSIGSALHVLDAQSSFGSGIGDHLDVDCPIGVTAVCAQDVDVERPDEVAATGEEEVEPVAAQSEVQNFLGKVVVDLKQTWTNSVTHFESLSNSPFPSTAPVQTK